MTRGFLLVAVLVAGLVFDQLVYARDLVVVTNAEFPIRALSVDQVTQVYLGEGLRSVKVPIWPVALVVGVDPHADFLRSVLAVSEAQYNLLWARKVFRGEAVPPREMPSAAALLAEVREHPGGIGYIYGEDLRGAADLREVYRIHLPDPEPLF